MFGPENVLIILQDDISAHPERVLEGVCDFVKIAPQPAPMTAQERVNVASLPAYPALARLATRGADWLRDRRLYGPIEAAKRLGFKRVYAGFQGDLPTLAPQIRRELVKGFEPDIAYVEKLLHRPLPQWRQ